MLMKELKKKKLISSRLYNYLCFAFRDASNNLKEYYAMIAGHIWNCTYVGDVCVSKEYVKDPDDIGTADNPITWKPGVQLIPNAFYIYKNVTYVYVGEVSEAGNEFDYPNFEEM